MLTHIETPENASDFESIFERICILKYLTYLFVFQVFLRIFSTNSYAEDTSIGIRARTYPSYSQRLNEDFLLSELGFDTYTNFHAAIGMIIGVPKDKAQDLLNEVRKFMRMTYDIRTYKLKFDVTEVDRFKEGRKDYGEIGRKYYTGGSLILLPSAEDSRSFKELNRKLYNFLKCKAATDKAYSNTRLDVPTSPQNYIPHITINTPTKLKGHGVESAINKMNSDPKKYLHTVFFEDYGITIRSVQ